MKTYRNITQLAHEWAGTFIKAGDFVVDATCGNGHDTLFLAEKVGVEGHVAAFDIQASAIESTQKRLAGTACKNVDYFLRSHAEMLLALPAAWRGKVSAVFFNLGYLPTSNREIVTQGRETLLALEAAQELLSPSGVISIAVYTKHAGGYEESALVWDWLKRVPAREIRRWGRHNPETPWLVLVK